MRPYIGIKRVFASQMTRGEYNKLRGWSLPENENPDDEGYLVEYEDSTPNVKNFEGYISWSPKEPFEKHYLELAR